MCDDRVAVTYVSRDGVKLYYEQAGRGDSHLLLVPGWCCDQTAFAPQFEFFAETHVVTALAPRGCGLSDCPPGGYDIPGLADDVAWLCAEIGIERPVVVGHSLGGMIAVELGARHPFLPRALVGVDPGPLHKTEVSAATFDAFAQQLAGPTGEDVRRAWVEDTPGPSIGDTLREEIVEMMCGVPLPAARAMIEGVAAWNGVAALGMCTTPLLVLTSGPAPGGSNDPARLRTVKPDTQFGMTVGAGHFIQLEVPDQVNAMIERFLASAV
jgi:pimeloyl-ACP methyl ester carboxylesterase